MSSHLKAAILLAILGVIFTGVFIFNRIPKPQQDSQTSGAPLPVIIVGTAPPSSNDLAARVIKKMGWDKEAGYILEQRNIAIEATVPAMIGGAVDIIGMTPLTAISTIDSERPIKIIANGNIVSCPFFVPGDSPAQSWQDLRGKRLGMTSNVGPSYNTTRMAFKLKEGIDINKEFQVSHSPTQELIPRLVRGEIDAALGRCGEVGIAKAIVEAKFKTIGNMTDILYKDGEYKELMMEAMISTKVWTEGHKDLVDKFRKTLYKAYAYIKENPEIFDDPDIQKAYALDSAEPAVITKIKELVPQFYTFVDWPVVVDSQTKFLEAAKKEGLLNEVPPKEELFYNPTESIQ